MNGVISVKKTVPYSDYSGKHPIVKTVCKGKLILLWGDCRKKEFFKYGLESHDKTQGAQPIIISETEELDDFDNYYDSELNTILRASINHTDNVKHKCYKILYLPKHFSNIHLEAIKKGSLNDGDEVFVECENICSQTGLPCGMPCNGDCNINAMKMVKLTDNSINLFPVKKQENNAVKILKTEQYRDGNENLITVCKVKLVLHRNIVGAEVNIGGKGYIPFFISETEEIRAHDIRYANDIGLSDTSVNEEFILRQEKGIWNKIVGYSFHLSEKYNSAIRSQEMKDGDEFFAECENCKVDYVTNVWNPEGFYVGQQIKLTDNGRLKLYRMESGNLKPFEIKNLTVQPMKPKPYKKQSYILNLLSDPKVIDLLVICHEEAKKINGTFEQTKNAVIKYFESNK